MKLENDSKHDVNDCLNKGICSNCEKKLKFDVYPDHDSIGWTAECDCGYTTYLSMGPEISVCVDKDD